MAFLRIVAALMVLGVGACGAFMLFTWAGFSRMDAGGGFDLGYLAGAAAIGIASVVIAVWLVTYGRRARA